MTVLAITTCRIVDWVDKFDAPSNEVFGFEAVRYHTDGTVTPANGTDSTESNVEGFATVESDRVGQAITVVRDGLLDVGNALSAVAIGTAIYLADTDGQLSDGTGDSTVDVIIGRVVPGWGSLTADKLLLIRKGG
jgi:hypothetical protein